MKIMTKKVLYIMFPVIIVISAGIISNVSSFNFMNYNYILNRYAFIFIYILMILLLSKKINNNNLKLDDIYYYRLHIVLNIIVIFLFFFYKIFVINLLCMFFIFSLVFIFNCY